MFQNSSGEYLPSRLVLSALLLNLLLVPLEILDHEILACQLEMVAVMVDPLSGRQVDVVEEFVNRVSFDPEDVPVFPTLI